MASRYQQACFLRIILLVLSFFIYINVSAQELRRTIDSLQHKLDRSAEKDKALIYAELAADYHHVSNDTILMYAEKSLNLANKYNIDEAKVKAYTWLGTVEKDLGKYTEALDHHLKALTIAEQIKDEQSMARIYNGIGIIYKKMKRWDEALAFYKKANVMALKYNKLSAASYTYNNIGTIYLEKELWDSVVCYYDSAVIYAEKAKNNRAMSTVLFNLGDTYRAHKEYKKALSASLRCLQYDKLNEDKYGMFMSYFQIARIYEEKKDFDQSALYADSAENIVIVEKLNREHIDILAWRANVEEAQGNYKEAFNYFRQSRFIRDTLLTEATARQVSELQTKYETEKKEQKIELQKVQLSRKNYFIGGISALLLLGSLLGSSSYRRYQLAQQDKLQKEIIKQQELATKAVIDAEENERKRIAGDLHDGVGQVMSAARMNLSAIGNEIPFSNNDQKHAFEKALALVDEGCKEVRTVSHNIMPNALLKSGLSSAIREFIDKIDQRVLKVNLYTEGLNERLPSNIETVLYRVIQECINNVIKHSGANTLDITMLKDSEEISITIEDNGKGFNTADKKKFDGIGLKNMQTRIDYLKGHIEWDSAPGKGTVVTINIPA